MENWGYYPTYVKLGGFPWSRPRSPRCAPRVLPPRWEGRVETTEDGHVTHKNCSRPLIEATNWKETGFIIIIPIREKIKKWQHVVFNRDVHVMSLLVGRINIWHNACVCMLVSCISPPLGNCGREKNLRVVFEYLRIMMNPLGLICPTKKTFNIEVRQNKNRYPYLFVLIFIYFSSPNDMLLICLANEKHPPSQLGYGYFNPKTVKHRLLYHSATCQDRHLQQFSQVKQYLFPKRLNLTTKQKNRRKHRPSEEKTHPTLPDICHNNFICYLFSAEHVHDQSLSICTLGTKLGPPNENMEKL